MGRIKVKPVLVSEEARLMYDGMHSGVRMAHSLSMDICSVEVSLFALSSAVSMQSRVEQALPILEIFELSRLSLATTLAREGREDEELIVANCFEVCEEIGIVLSPLYHGIDSVQNIDMAEDGLCKWSEL